VAPSPEEAFEVVRGDEGIVDEPGRRLHFVRHGEDMSEETVS
jgi:hypothetical protein